jgi:catechol 2,3-dioxygenase-like lactoylglutathione lyase family enzyme
VTVEKLSAVTLKVASMPTSVRFYRDLLGLEIIYGGEDAYFSSLRTKHGKDPILNLESGNSVAQWGRLIFYVSDVDRFWAYLKDCVPRGRKTLHGVNAISIWPTQMATSCRLHGRSSSLPVAASPRDLRG